MERSDEEQEIDSESANEDLEFSEDDSEVSYESGLEGSIGSFEDEYYNVDGEATANVSYTFPSRITKTGIKTNRMKYRKVGFEDVGKFVKEKMENLDLFLEVGSDSCLILLLEYGWNNDKLIEDFTSQDASKFRAERGIHHNLSKDFCGIETITDKSFECQICFRSPTDDEPMNVFHLSGCDHPFCVECFITYIITAIEDSNWLISCPEPSCKMVMTLTELKEIGSYEFGKRIAAEKKDKELKRLQANRPISEQKLMEKYEQDWVDSEQQKDNESEESLDDYDDEDCDKISEDGDKNDSDKKTSSESSSDSEEDYTTGYMDYKEWMVARERDERDRRRKKTLYLRYWMGIINSYCSRKYSNFKNCPYPDCDSMVMQLGFDSDQIATLDEFVSHNFIPSVECDHNHVFCYNCMTDDHTPCPCEIAKEWMKLCKDETETKHWIAANTKDCPKCGSIIEKNGGCNQMVCAKCKYEFCWICMKSWDLHTSHFSCNQPKNLDDDIEDEKDDHARTLKKYIHYFDLFNDQRISLQADKKLLEKAERHVRHMQHENGISWIETLFYREAIKTLLEARRLLMWSYAVMYFADRKSSKQLAEISQGSVFIYVERLSRLFLDTKIDNILKQKKKFLDYGAMVKKAEMVLKETFIDSIAGNMIDLRSFKK